MPEIEHSLIEQLRDAAVSLSDRRVTEELEALDEQLARAKLRILVAGTPGTGRASVINAMFRQPELLPTTVVPKLPVPLELRFGSAREVEIQNFSDGRRRALPPDRLRAFVTDSEARSMQRITVRAPCEALTICDLNVIPIAEPEGDQNNDGVRPDESGGSHDESGSRHDESGGYYDYVLVVVNAAALLSHREREFIRRRLVPYGLQRVAIIVNQIDLVPEDERESILELVQTFLGPFEAQPAILAVSATEALRELSVGSPTAGGSLAALVTLFEDLTNRSGALQDAAMREALDGFLTELEHGAERQRAGASLQREEVAELQATIGARRAWLEGRIARAQSKADTFLDTLIKEQLLHQVEGFGDLISRQISDEVPSLGVLSGSRGLRTPPAEGSGPSMAAIKRHLPGYIETVWTDFLRTQMISFNSRVLDETARIERMIESDLAVLLDGQAANLESGLEGFGPVSISLRPFVMPRRGKHRAEGVSRNLSLHGYIMLFFDPPAGIISLAASHLVRRFYGGDIELADRRAIADSAVNASRELERDLRRNIQEQFSALATRVKEEIAAAYAEGLDSIEQLLAVSAAQQEGAEERRRQLGTLVSRTIPDLRRRIDHAFGKEDARFSVAT